LSYNNYKLSISIGDKLPNLNKINKSWSRMKHGVLNVQQVPARICELHIKMKLQMCTV